MAVTKPDDKAILQGNGETYKSTTTPEFAAGTSLDLSPTAPHDADVPLSAVILWLDEANDQLAFKVKYSDGTVKTGRVDLEA